MNKNYLSALRIEERIFAILMIALTVVLSPVPGQAENSTETEDSGAVKTDAEDIKTAPEHKSSREKELEQLTKITITADPRNKSLLEYTQPASVVTKEELILRSDLTLGETLATEPGVSSTYFGPGSSRPVIRGFAGERIRILRNGVGSLDVSNTSEDHQISINPLTIESAEILRGPETLLYGSSAIGGVVNVTDGSIPSKEIGEAVHGEFNLRTQTVNNEATGALKLEGQLGNFNWHISGLSQDTGDIDIPGYQESSRLRAQEAAQGEEHEQVRGTLPDSATRTLTGTVGGSYVWEKGYLGVAVTGYDSKYGIPVHGHGHSHDHGHGHDDHDEDGVYIELQQYRIDTRGEIRDISENIEKIKFAAAASTYEHKEFEEGMAATTFTNDAFEARAELFHAPIAEFSGVIGTQVEYSDFTSSGLEAFVPDSERFAPGLFIFEELPLIDEHLSAQFGGRIEYVHLSPDIGYRERSFNPLSLSTGLSWDITGMSDYIAGISVAYAERAPSATELYADGIHVARSIAEIGDASLSNESSYGVDLTFRKNHGILTGGIALFAQEYGNYINLESTGRNIGGLQEFAYEETRARFIGFEAETTFHLHEALGWYANHLDLSAQLDYVRARDLRNSSDLPRITPLRSVVRARYGWKELFRIGLEGVFVAAQRDIADGELPTDAYQLVNATFDMHIPWLKDRNLMFYARGQNLTDAEARVHASFIKDMAPLPGRSFITGIRGVF
jgi:iron complex outermembrane recepter protein